MTSNSDIEVWAKTVVDERVDNPIVSRESLYITDSNSGSYNGQIVFDTNLLSHSSKWLNFNEAYIQVPLSLSMRSSIAVGADVPNAYMAGLKCGYYQLVDSISVEYGTKNAVQLQNYLNFHTQFKMITKSSYNDLIKNGASIGFIPDSSGSYQFVNTSSALGDGYSNNDETEIPAEVYLDPDEANDGFLQRRKKTTAFNANTAYGSLNTTTSAEQCRRIGKNHFTFNAADTTTRLYNWYVLMTIRLKDLSDFFEQIPLVKNANMRITVNYNSSSTEIAKVGTAVAGTQSISRHTQLSGHTNICMVGTRSVGGSCASLALATDATITVAYGVMTNALGADRSGHSITSCRLYVPAYKLSPMKELALIKSKPVTTIRYNDIYSYTFSVGAAPQSFNQILTNGIVNAKYLLICPFVRSNVDGTFASANVRIPVWQSVFDSAPGTTSPLVSLTDLQVQLAGENVWSQNQRYDFEQFQEELSKIYAIMGNTVTGETSGVISKFDFDNAYRYYVCDLSRKDSSENNVPKAIQVSGTNNSSTQLDLVCFIAYEREFKIDTMTGEPL